MNNLHIIKQNQLVFTYYKTAWYWGNNGLPYGQVNPVLFKTSPDGGTLITSKEFIKLGDTYVQFMSNVFESDDDSLVLIGDGLHEGDSIPAIVFAKCDHNFNTGTIRTYPVFTYARVKEYYSSFPSNRFMGGSSFKRHPEGGYYGMMNTFGFKKLNTPDSSWVADTPFIIHIYRFDKFGSIIQNNQINLPYIAGRRDVEYSPLLKQYITSDISNESYLMDSAFHLIKHTPTDFVTPGDEYIASGVNSIIPYKNRHIVAGGYYRTVQLPDQTYFVDRYISLVILSDSLKITHKYFIRPIANDSGNGKNTACFKAIDYISEDSIFIVYSEDQWYTYTVCMIDSNFNVRWARKDSMAYFVDLQSINATPDGGCIVTGYLTRNFFDIVMLVVKYEKSGMISSVRYFEKNMNEITIFPNPGSDKIIISGASQNRNFTLYDITGRSVVYASNEELIHGINVSSLKQGIYFYTITDKNTGAVKSGKWMKSIKW